MPKKLLATTIILSTILALAVGIHAVEVVNADPFFIFHQVDPVPGTTLPSITILSPQNNQEYHSDKVIINFNVSKPQLGTCDTAIIEVKYIIDGKSNETFTIWRQEGHTVGASSSNAVPEFDTIFTSPSLSQGNHYLTVFAKGVVYPGNLSIFFSTSSKTVNFIMGEQTTQLKPIPSQISTPKPTRLAEPTSISNISPTPTINTQHPTINTGPEPPKTEPFPTALIAAVSLAVFTLAAAGLLIYLKKHRH